MSRTGTYDLKYGFIPDDDCPHGTPRKTNADRIRSMSDEELCDEYFRILNYELLKYTDSRQGLLHWMKQEAE